MTLNDNQMLTLKPPSQDDLDAAALVLSLMNNSASKTTVEAAPSSTSKETANKGSSSSGDKAPKDGEVDGTPVSSPSTRGSGTPKITLRLSRANQA